MRRLPSITSNARAGVERAKRSVPAIDFAIQTIQFPPVAIRRRYRRAAECWQAVSMTSKKTTRQDEQRQDGQRQDEPRQDERRQAARRQSDQPPPAPEAPGRKPLLPPRKAGPAPDQERYE